MNTTWAVVKIRPEKKFRTGLNFFSGLIFTTALVVFITAKTSFIYSHLLFLSLLSLIKKESQRVPYIDQQISQVNKTFWRNSTEVINM